MQAFSLTWDYRCPFARNAHEHVLAGLAAGADWDPHFVPFSLSQLHVEEGQRDIWDRPHDDSGLLAMQVGLVVRDWYPDKFPAVHGQLFAIRHHHGRSLRDETLLREVLESARVDADAVFEEIAGGKPLAAVKAEHTEAVERHQVWGVPTFIVGDQAAFVRLTNRPEGDNELGRATVQRVLDLLAWPELNEFKHTTVAR